jgi:hypothetical protein
MEQKASSRLSALSLDRLSTRRPVELAEAETVSETPKPSSGYRQPSRRSTRMIAGHFDPDVSLALQELLATVSRKQRKRVTVQDALTEALRLYFEKHGATPPDALGQ